MAWAEKLPGGKWRGGWRDADGDKQYTKKATHPEHPYDRKRDAKAAASQAEVKAQRRAAVTKGTLSARTVWGEWWDLIKHKRVKVDADTHVAEFALADRYLVPVWGGEPLYAIKRKALQQWVDELTLGRVTEWEHKQPPEPSTVHRIYAVFRWTIKHAMDEGILDASPCAGIKLPKVRKKRRPHLAVDEAETIGKRMRPHNRDAVRFDVDTGLRPNELCGLHADRIDRKRGAHGVVVVDQVYVQGQGVIRPFPKDKDARIVPLTATAREIADRQLVGRDLSQGCGLIHTDDTKCTSPLIFVNARGEPLNPRSLNKAMVRASNKTGIARRTPYSGRRGYATRLADGGSDIVDIARALGHETLEQAAAYVQETPAAQQRLLAALGERPALTVIQGQAGAEDGADLDSQPRPTTPIEEGGSVG
jgi:integrase